MPGSGRSVGTPVGKYLELTLLRVSTHGSKRCNRGHHEFLLTRLNPLEGHMKLMNLRTRIPRLLLNYGRLNREDGNGRQIGS